MGATSQNKEKFHDYDGFVEKFKPKKTTDDCYTPPIVYDAIADWVCRTYGVDRDAIVRPFYPGGDYEHAEYPEGCLVLDNPPFSILSQIIRFYDEREIRYFLFAPSLTLFTGASRSLDRCYLVADAAIVYDNGAVVKTGFITNLDNALVRTSPELHKIIDDANTANLRQQKGKTLPKYEYPDHVLTAAKAQYFCSHGIQYELSKKDATFIRALDAQRSEGKSIFGGGFLLSERAAAERFTISERERVIISALG